MAYQTKSYRKFVATAATAALVASAVAPAASAASVSQFKDVAAKYQDAVKYLVDNGITEGTSKTTFGTYDSVKRGDAAVWIAKALKLDTSKAPDAGFKDVNSRVAGAVNALYAAKIISGKSATSFAPDATLTRGEMAKIIANAYNLESNKDVPFKDLGPTFGPYIKALYEFGITTGTSETTFGTGNNITRGDFAIFLKRASEVAPEVKSVSAINTTTLTLTGTGLKGLKAENLTIAGNTVSEVTSTDGKTATVKLAAALVPDQEYSLVVKVKDVEKTLNFKFTYEVTKAAVVAGTFDDDTKGQKLQLKINDADADFDALKVAGYTVKFVAVDKDNNDVSADFFKDVATGALADSLTIGDYTVQVSVSKGSTVVVSEKQTIKVRNQELAATAVKSYVLTNTNVAEQKSSTLVVGETATIDEITVTANGADFDVTDIDKFKVSSSSPAVVSVSGNTLTANTPGTATISVSYGDVKKDFTVTVANTDRKVAKFTPASTSVAIVGTNGKTATVSVSAVDQYGDLVANAPIYVEAPTSIATSANTTTEADGKATVTLTSVAAGSGVVVLKNDSGTTLGSFGVRVTQHDNVASKRLEIVKKPDDKTYSADNTLDLNADLNVEYALNFYNSENLPNGKADLQADDYKVSYNADIVTIGTAATGLQDKVAIDGENLTITAKAVGSTNVAIYDSANLLVGQFTITVTNTGYSINSVSFKTVPTIDYKNKTITVRDVLDVVSSHNDDIVKGITLNKPTAHAIRIDEATGELYIDADGNGLYTPGEVVLATVTGEVASGATNLQVGAFDIFTGITTTATGDKGTVIFKVLENDGKTIKASTSVNVDVK
ncbi:hypothetical protein J27TS8_41020 [Robertmurraya siralis]|uniref:S-layer homology domain-containing protein n=1 Tax=Robertmurraya siralis TaxID=77777 RepID=A0A919WM34_9BACI|nr:S-layer homology domain-containing protein [Robertmurraya siralis]PAE19747.1 hypothetical protein CHH80_15035 [Bacillus sp. 7504-2]GIN64109.1 hypothetical protein J27TS8_41020 [Robertmurraya siralis]